MSFCPTCHQKLPEPKPGATIKTAADLVAAMQVCGGDGKTKDVYVDGNNTGYFLTYTRGPVVARRAIDEALAIGEIMPTFPDIPDGHWSLIAKAQEIHRKWVAIHERQLRDGNAKAAAVRARGVRLDPRIIAAMATSS